MRRLGESKDLHQYPQESMRCMCVYTRSLSNIQWPERHWLNRSMTCNKDTWLIASGSISILGCHLRLNHFITPSDTSRPTKIRGCPTEAILRATYIQWTVIAVSRCIFCEHLALSLKFRELYGLLTTTFCHCIASASTIAIPTKCRTKTTISTGATATRCTVLGWWAGSAGVSGSSLP